MPQQPQYNLSGIPKKLNFSGIPKVDVTELPGYGERGDIFLNTPAGQAIKAPLEKFGEAMGQMRQNPIAGGLNIFNSLFQTAALPFSLAETGIRQIPAVGEPIAEIAGMPFKAAGELGQKTVPVELIQAMFPGEKGKQIAGALQNTMSGVGQIMVGGGFKKPKVTKPVETPFSGISKVETPKTAPLVEIPPSFRAKMIQGLGGKEVQTRFGKVGKLSDTDLATVYQEKGLDKPAPLSEAPVSMGGSMEVRGPANVAQIEKLVQPSKLPAKIDTPETAIETYKHAFNINKERLNITEQGAKQLDRTVSAIRPELEKVKGKKLTNAEVIEAAQTSDLLRKTVSREQTKQAEAALLRTRQALAAGAEGKGISPDFIKNVQVVSSWAADAGRKLQSFNIQADPTVFNVKEIVSKKLLDLGLEADKIVEASKDVDFNNPKQVAKFYRQFVKPTWGELIDEFRYINMLSSPKTHIVNAFSNFLQGGFVAPVTKLYLGGIDFVGSALTGKPREHYVREVPQYVKGAFNALGEASKQALDVLKGEKFTLRPDIESIPSMGEGATAPARVVSKFNEQFRGITNALEAADVFFQTIIRAGERENIAYNLSRKGKEIDYASIDAEATKRAKEYLFRSELDPKNVSGQGKLLSWIDKVSSTAYKLRSVPVAGWFIPFIRTPMNILKQGIQYSPAGLATLPGATNKPLVLARSLVGSTVFAGAGALVANNESTWEAPRNAKEKEQFYNSGKQPYSIKLGDTWYSYSKLGIMAYPIALAAATKYYTSQSKDARDSNTLQKLENILVSQVQFFSDQSYVQGIRSLLDAASGETADIERALTNIPSQFVPLGSLQNWVANTLDPVYRKPENVLEGLAVRSPFTRAQVDVTGVAKQPIYGLPPGLVNALSPVQMSADPFGGFPYRPRQQRKTNEY